MDSDRIDSTTIPWLSWPTGILLACIGFVAATFYSETFNAYFVLAVDTGGGVLLIGYVAFLERNRFRQSLLVAAAIVLLLLPMFVLLVYAAQGAFELYANFVHF